MPAPKGNRNAVKHGLYAKHFTADVQPELLRMPVDSVLMELAALRLTALRAMDLYVSSLSQDEKARAIVIAVNALETAANIVSKAQLLNGDVPILQDLWTAIQEANQIEGVDDAV